MVIDSIESRLSTLFSIKIQIKSESDVNILGDNNSEESMDKFYGGKTSNTLKSAK